MTESENERMLMSLSPYYHSTLTRKGQATIPVELREKLGLKEGDTLVWRAVDGVISVTSAHQHVQRMSGMLKPFIDPAIASPTLEEMEEAIESVVTEKYQKLAGQR